MPAVSWFVLHDDEVETGEAGVDIYNLTKYTRSNQNTYINQRPLVSVGDVIAVATSWPMVRPPIWVNWRWVRTCASRSCPGTATTSKTRSCSPSALLQEDRFTTIHIEELTVRGP